MTSADATPRGFMPLTSRRSLLCMRCLRELGREAAKFHRLRCKTGTASRVIVDGEYMEHRDAAHK